jgi:hypothetical protein
MCRFPTCFFQKRLTLATLNAPIAQAEVSLDGGGDLESAMDLRGLNKTWFTTCIICIVISGAGTRTPDTRIMIPLL